MGYLVSALVILLTLYNFFKKKDSPSDEPTNQMMIEEMINLSKAVERLTITFEQYTRTLEEQKDKLEKQDGILTDHDKRLDRHEFRLESLERKQN